jgi:diaminohydroxyphosphoribosylaminopyrimidine deaminase/5-amino-6-(5-phosphoribosylamino)uracil reductase
VLDKQLRLPPDAAIFDKDGPVLVLNYLDERVDGSIHFLKLSYGENILLALLDILYKRSVNSLIVEGGSILLQSFIDAGFWDEAIIITNTSMSIQHGIAAVNAPAGVLKQKFDFGSDEIMVYKNTWQ